MNRGWANAEVLLHVGFGRWPAVQARVEVDKRQILALLRRKGFFRAAHAGHPIELCVRASIEEEAWMNLRYRVELSQTERAELTALLSAGKHAARKFKRAQILLAADAGASDEEIARSVGVGGSTVFRTKRRFVLGNLQAALSEESRPGAMRKLSGNMRLRPPFPSPPAGRARWTLELLAGELVRLTEHAGVSRETVRRRLAENDLKPWRKDMWCIPRVDAEYVARMEDVLDLYAEAPDPNRPVVCFDESPIQLIGEVREPIPAKPGQLERYDCEYKRNGTANLFVFLDVHRPWRKVKVTESRAAVDFAACMRELATRETAGQRGSAHCQMQKSPAHNLHAVSFRKAGIAPTHSALIFAALMIWHHCSISALLEGAQAHRVVAGRGCARARPSCSNASTIPCQGVRWSPGKPTSLDRG